MTFIFIHVLLFFSRILFLRFIFKQQQKLENKLNRCVLPPSYFKKFELEKYFIRDIRIHIIIKSYLYSNLRYNCSIEIYKSVLVIELDMRV